MAPLCSSCQHAHCFTRANGATTTICDVSTEPIRVPGDILTCSKYHHKGQPDEWDFEKIAWVLQSEKRGKPLGFRPPKKKDE